jgi:hypothetical protein
MLSSSYPPNTAPATHLIAGPAIATTLTESDEIDPLLTARPSVVVERSTTGVPGGCNGNWLNGTACQWTGPDQMDAHPHLAKVRVAGSNPVFRSNIFRIGRERRERTAAGNRRAGPDRPTDPDRPTPTGAHSHAGRGTRRQSRNGAGHTPPEKRSGGGARKRGGGAFGGRVFLVCGVAPNGTSGAVRQSWCVERYPALPLYRGRWGGTVESPPAFLFCPVRSQRNL